MTSHPSHRLELRIASAQEGSGLTLEALEADETPSPVLEVGAPVCIETWSVGGAIERHELGYESVATDPDGFLGKSVLVRPTYHVRVRDRWHRVAPDTWRVDRQLRADGEPGGEGVRLRLDLETAISGGAAYQDVRIFAPPAMYDHNDLDDDGVDDYLGTRTLAYREDRLNALSILVFHPAKGWGISMIRADTPEFDDVPHRPARERTFLQATDVGSLGVRPDEAGRQQVVLGSAYPFDEGERSHALLLLERPGWGAFWPVAERPALSVSYQVRLETGSRFVDVAWSHFARRLQELNPVPVPLPADPDELLRLRIDSLDRYYLEGVDPDDPAGYVLNCHPQDGVQLADIIQYGFTGQNILNALLALRWASAHGDERIGSRARKVVDFFVRRAHMPETGLFYDLYNAPKGRMDCWWTGLLLPLAYADPGGSLEELMGPLQKRWEPEIRALRGMRGSYLRCMSESVHALVLAYRFEASQGRDHTDWLDAAVRYGEFLVRAQEPDGSWYRAYYHDGRPISEPAIWFGSTFYEQRASSATPILILVALADATGDRRYLEAAIRAGRFVRDVLVEPVRANGGIHDPIYAKGQLIDNEGILYPMLGLLALHEAVVGDEFLSPAIDAARLFASWICLWDVPLPPDSTLAHHGFRSTGIGACDTAGAGYVHPFELLALPELIEIAGLAGDPALFGTAELAYGGCNQTVAVPGRDWGYAFAGLQEEGYLMSWWLVDDPIFDETGFGHRWKGEGNKTCFPWIPAVGMACHWKLLDRYGTTDFNEIRRLVGFPRQG